MSDLKPPERMMGVYPFSLRVLMVCMAVGSMVSM